MKIKTKIQWWCAFGEGFFGWFVCFEEAIKFKWGQLGGANLLALVFLEEQEEEIQGTSFSTNEDAARWPSDARERACTRNPPWNPPQRPLALRLAASRTSAIQDGTWQQIILSPEASLDWAILSDFSCFLRPWQFGGLVGAFVTEEWRRGTLCSKSPPGPWFWGLYDTPYPRAEKPQQDNRCWSSSCMVLEWLWGDAPCPRAKKKPQQDGKRGKIEFGIKPNIHQRRSEGSNKPCVHQDPETETNLCLEKKKNKQKNCVWVSLEEVRVSSGLPRGQGLWGQ